MGKKLKNEQAKAAAAPANEYFYSFSYVGESEDEEGEWMLDVNTWTGPEDRPTEIAGVFFSKIFERYEDNFTLLDFCTAEYSHDIRSTKGRTQLMAETAWILEQAGFKPLIKAGSLRSTVTPQEPEVCKNYKSIYSLSLSDTFKVKTGAIFDEQKFLAESKKVQAMVRIYKPDSLEVHKAGTGKTVDIFLNPKGEVINVVLGSKLKITPAKVTPPQP